MEPDWDLAAQPAPDFEVDQRVNWSMVEAAILTRCALAMHPTYTAHCQSLLRTAHFGAGSARHGLTAGTVGGSTWSEGCSEFFQGPILGLMRLKCISVIYPFVHTNHPSFQCITLNHYVVTQ